MSPYQTYFLIGRCLALDIIPSHREVVSAAFQSGSINWNLFVQTANDHLVLQTLYPLLSKHDLLQFLPSDLAAYLQTIHSLNTERNRKILEQVREINAALNPQGIYPIYLKGVGNLLDGLYADPGERIIQDIDFLVPEQEMEKAADILITRGYSSQIPFIPAKKYNSKHYPRLQKADTVASLEVHYTAVTLKYQKLLPAEQIEHAKHEVTTSGKCFVASDSHKLLHNFIHSQLDHHGIQYGMIFMRSLYDALLVSQRTGPVKAFEGLPKFHKHAMEFMQLVNLTFGLDPAQYRKYRLNLYPFKYKLILRYPAVKFFFQFYGYLVSVILPKTWRSFFKKPMLAIKDRELRKHLIRSIKDPAWYKRQWAIYRKLFP